MSSFCRTAVANVGGQTFGEAGVKATTDISGSKKFVVGSKRFIEYENFFIIIWYLKSITDRR